jgi:hypothetical protein
MSRPPVTTPLHFLEIPQEQMLERARLLATEMHRRRTVREFDSRPVPREIIAECLRAACSAPSGANYHRLRAQIVPAQRGRGGSAGPGQGSAVPTHVAMSWAQRLKRVFGIEIESCQHGGGAVKIIASIEDPQVIGCILEHLGLDGSNAHGQQLPPARAPPSGASGLFD